MPSDSATATTRRRALPWLALALAAAGIGGSFVLRGGEEAAAEKRGGARALPVSAVVAQRQAITERGRYPGELDADAADVSAFYAGRLIAVRVRVGDTVAEGDVLAELDPVDAHEQIARAQAQAAAAVAEEKRVAVEIDAAAAELARMEPLEGEIITSSELEAQRARTEALRAAAVTAAARGAEARAGVMLLQKRVMESRVRAPFAGRVAARYVDPGAIVAAGARLVRVVATSPLRVRFDVPSHEVDALAVGTPVRVVTRGGAAGDGTAGPGVAATIRGIAGEISRDRRVAAVEAVIDAPPPGWLPGMFAEAIVERRTLPEATVVPGRALLSRLEGATLTEGVFRVDGDVARWTPVTVAARDGDRVAVDAPAITPGVMVLVAGHQDLADGGRIKVAATAAPAGSP